MRGIQTGLCLLCAYVILQRPQATGNSLRPGTSSKPGSPLTEDEYMEFWEIFQPEWKAKYICNIRETLGCEESRVRRFDQYENHGSIPNGGTVILLLKGTVCAALRTRSPFLTFCKFALYRCSSEQYYLKRILCADDQPVNVSQIPKGSQPPTTKGPVRQSTTIPRPSTTMHLSTAKSTKSSSKPTSSLPQDKRDEAGLPSALHTHIVNLLRLSLRVNDAEPPQSDSDKKIPIRERRSKSNSPSKQAKARHRLLYKEQKEILESTYDNLDHKKTKA
uniref:Acrosin-binding protein n=1 Tax=Leptobrachium leishanense TaxID=445787 RepID=A0A8C5MS47_9ANUR